MATCNWFSRVSRTTHISKHRGHSLHATSRLVWLQKTQADKGVDDLLHRLNTLPVIIPAGCTSLGSSASRCMHQQAPQGSNPCIRRPALCRPYLVVVSTKVQSIRSRTRPSRLVKHRGQCITLWVATYHPALFSYIRNNSWGLKTATSIFEAKITTRGIKLFADLNSSMPIISEIFTLSSCYRILILQTNKQCNHL